MVSSSDLGTRRERWRPSSPLPACAILFDLAGLYFRIRRHTMYALVCGPAIPPSFSSIQAPDNLAWPARDHVVHNCCHPR